MEVGVGRERVYLVDYIVKKSDADDGSWCRICYLVERLWRRCGGGQGSACMSRKDDGSAAGLDLRLELQCDEFHGTMSR